MTPSKVLGTHETIIIIFNSLINIDTSLTSLSSISIVTWSLHSSLSTLSVNKVLSHDWSVPPILICQWLSTILFLLNPVEWVSIGSSLLPSLVSLLVSSRPSSWLSLIVMVTWQEIHQDCYKNNNDIKSILKDVDSDTNIENFVISIANKRQYQNFNWTRFDFSGSAIIIIIIIIYTSCWNPIWSIHTGN